MSAAWIVIFPGTTADAPVYANEEAARAMVERTNAETAGNVEAVAMPLHIAVAGLELVNALRNCVKAQDVTGGAKGSTEFACTEGARHLLKQLGEWTK